MNKHLLRIFILFIALVAAGRNTSAQTSNQFYSDLPTSSATGKDLSKSFSNYRLVKVDLISANQFVQNFNAQSKGKTSALASITLPMPDGSNMLFTLTPTNVLIEEIAAQHPEILTFSGTSVDGETSLRLTVSPYGIGGVMNGKGFKAYISAVDPSKPNVVIVYDVKDVIVPQGMKCGAGDEPLKNSNAPLHKEIHGIPLFGDCQLRTYVLSIAATGEYTAWAGGTQPQALAAITTTVNNINAIYERDLAIRFTLNSPVGILYTNAGTDPYATVGFPTGSGAGNTLTSNQTAIDAVVGSANYDEGMVFNDGWNGGLAQLQSVCGSGKARAAAGLSSGTFAAGPSGSIFENTVAHEMGHQFDATHSFSANNGSCGSNISASTGWEAGGGSTIMSYGASCTGNYYQFYGDNYFHSGNLAQMATFMTGTGNSCASVSASGNITPVNSFSPTSFTIPHSTPFKLSSGGTDANAGDVLTYTWEQMDPIGGTGISTPPVPTATTGPNFRSYPPSTIPTRYFPSLSVLAGVTSGTYEVLPTVARTMNFRATVRDNHTGAGCTASQAVPVTTANCGPFSITSHSSAGTLVANGSNTTSLTWNTASACVTCASINIKFSTDGGLTFPYTILSNTANDGSENIIVPNLPTCSGKFMIECPSSIFFNINTANITITSGCAANGATFSPSTDLSVAAPGDAALNMALTPQYGSQYPGTISGQLTGSDSAGSVTVLNTVTPGCINFNGNATRYDTYTIVPSVSGTYTFAGALSNFGLVYNLYDASYNASSPCTNFISSSATNNGSTSLTNSVSATLCARQTYVLVVSSFSATLPASLPAAYSVAVTTPGGGALFASAPQPASFNYCYVMVRNSTGNIVEISSTANLTNTTTYPAGNYTVYGISSNSTCSALNTSFQGQSFSVLNAAVLNQTSGLCASLSANYRLVAIGSVLSVKMLNFDAILRSNNVADVTWSMAQETGIKNYELQRSTDGQRFEAITTLPAHNTNSMAALTYGYTDNNIPRGISTVYYRLKIVEYNATELSGIVPLKLRNTTSSVAINPNPIQNDMLVASIISAGEGKLNASVTDITGRVLVSQQLHTQEGNSRLSINVGSLTPGMYILRVEMHGVIENVRFIKAL